MAAALSSHSSAYTVRQNADINVTPFVDVMLVLLIISWSRCRCRPWR